MTFGPRHYVPMLRTKVGELDALASLPAASRSLTSPLLDVTEFVQPSAPKPPKPGMKLRKGKAQRTTATHLPDMAARIAAACPSPSRCFIDVTWDWPSGAHPLAQLIDLLRARGVDAIPVTGASRSARHNAAVRTILAAHRTGVCARLTQSDLSSPGVATAKIRTATGLPPGRIDLVLDMGSVVGMTPGIVTLSQQSVVGALPTVGQWRTLTLASGAFPFPLSGVMTAGAFNPISRTDWLGWHGTVTASGIARKPSFGDYGVDHASPPPPVAVQPVANIRYCSSREWQVIRGTKAGGPGQMHAMCGQLVGMPFCAPANFSAGDAWWRARAGKSPATIGGGNASSWRQAAYSRHFVFVTDQLAKAHGI